MELRDLRYFCLTAELEHVTKAAERLSIAQPYLSRVIQQIEDEVGGKLFDKQGRRLKLNSYGEVFYRSAKKVLADMELLYDEMNYLFERKERTITLLANTESFSTHMIHAFNKTNPDYFLSILQVRFDEMEAALINGEADFVLSCPPLVTLGISDFIETINIFSVIGCLLFPPGHRLLQKDAVSIDDIRNEKIITMPRGSAMRNRIQPVFAENNYYPEIVFESDNLNVITQAVKNGVGLAFVTEVIMTEYPELWPYVKRIDVPDVVGHYGLSYNKLTISSEKAQHFKNFIVKFFDELTEKTIKNRPSFLELK